MTNRPGVARPVVLAAPFGRCMTTATPGGTRLHDPRDASDSRDPDRVRAARRPAHVPRDPRPGTAAAPAARRVHDCRHDGTAAARPGADAEGDRARAAGARAHG